MTGLHLDVPEHESAQADSRRLTTAPTGLETGFVPPFMFNRRWNGDNPAGAEDETGTFSRITANNFMSNSEHLEGHRRYTLYDEEVEESTGTVPMPRASLPDEENSDCSHALSINNYLRSPSEPMVCYGVRFPGLQITVYHTRLF